MGRFFNGLLQTKRFTCSACCISPICPSSCHHITWQRICLEEIKHQKWKNHIWWKDKIKLSYFYWDGTYFALLNIYLRSWSLYVYQTKLIVSVNIYTSEYNGWKNFQMNTFFFIECDIGILLRVIQKFDMEFVQNGSMGKRTCFIFSLYRTPKKNNRRIEMAVIQIIDN